MATLTWDGKKKRWRLNWKDSAKEQPRTREYYRKSDVGIAQERLNVVREYEVREKRGLPVSSPKSFAEVVLEYVERYLVAKAETHQHRETLRLKKSINPFFGGMPIGAISDKEIRDYVFMRRKSASNKTLRNELSTLSSIFTYAIDGQLIAENPVRKINTRSLLPALPTRAGRYVTNVELSKFLEKANLELMKGVIFLRETGLRIGELFPKKKALDISDFDLEREILVLKHQSHSPIKSKRNRIIPLTETVMDILSEVKSGPIFKYLRGGFEDAFYTALAKTEVRFSLHDLRHTFTSVLADAGMSAQRISQITGHSSLYIMTRYMHDVTRDVEVIRGDMEHALGRRQGAAFSNYLKTDANNASPRGFEPDSSKSVTHQKQRKCLKTGT